MKNTKYIDKVLDVRDLGETPLCVLRGKKALKLMSSGMTLHVTTKDRGSVKDFENLLSTTGDTLIHSSEQGGEYHFIIMKNGDSIIEKGAEVLTFGITSEGKIRVAIKKSNGQVIYANESILPCGLSYPVFNQYSEKIKELEEMVNNPDIKEQDLQYFFENNPEFLKGHKYDTLLPQAIIQHEGAISSNDSWKADFILSPNDEENFCKIIELKKT